MLDLSAAKIDACIMHFVGNKNLDESLQLSSDIVNLQNPHFAAVLQNFLLHGFKGDEVFCFGHSSDLNLNEVYTYVSNLFGSKDDLIDQSASIARWLHDCTDQPNLKGGYLLVATFGNCYLDSRVVQATGIFKFENTNHFFKIKNEIQQIDLVSEEGILMQKIEKGCLILNTKAEDGYWVSVIDSNKANESVYWRDHFLRIKPAEDSFHFTSNMLKITKDYVTKEMPDEFPISKTDSIEMLNRSLTYFKENDTFNKEAFAESVFLDERVIDSFKKFDVDYSKFNDLPEADNFEINNQAVKKQAKIFKSVLKLDKDFHIYIHGNREKIERGIDPDGRKFYKIYFEEEM